MNISELLSELSKIASSGKPLLASVVNSSGLESDNPYFTTLRSDKYLSLACFIVSSQHQALQLSAHLSSVISGWLVDVEKKIPYSATSGLINLGNIYTALRDVIAPSLLWPFKANDLTVDSIVDSLFRQYGDLAGLNIGVVGLGNIGFKASLSLLECGSNLKLFSRNYLHSESVVTAINKIKPVATLSSATCARDLQQVFASSDIIVLCSNYPVELSDFSIACALDSGSTLSRILVVGHNSLNCDDAIAISRVSPFFIERLDIGGTLLSCARNHIQSQIGSPAIASILSGYSEIACNGFYVTEDSTSIVNDIEIPTVLIKKAKHRPVEGLPLLSGPVYFENRV